MAVATVAPAHAGRSDRESEDSLQATPAVGEVSRTPFQQYHFTHCNTDEICTVDFRRVPSGSRLEITNVSCYLEVSARTGSPELRVAQLLLLRPNDSIATASTLLLGQQHTSFTSTGNLRGYAANHAIDVFAPAGHYFQAYADPLRPIDSVSFLACHISGDLVRLN
jgi:hypothetical protein